MTNGFQPRSSDAPLIVYFDIKSPYAFVAKDPTFQLADQLGIEIDWRPLTLDIPSYLGSAQLNKRGEVAKSNRTKQQWGGVRYAYMDARRYASAWGYTLRGTEKIWDTSLVHIAFSWVKQRAPQAVRQFLDLAYPRFWTRDLDVESLAVVSSLIESCGVSTTGFAQWADSDGRVQHDVEQAAIFADGIYGVPGYIYRADYYFGREHLPRIEGLIKGFDGSAVDIAYSLPATPLIAEGVGSKHEVFLSMRRAAAAGKLSIVAGVNEGCQQSHLALAALQDIRWDFPNLLSVDFGELASENASHPADNDKANILVDPTEDRPAAHRQFRSSYARADIERYVKSLNLDDSVLNGKRIEEITFSERAKTQLETNGVSRSFGFLFVDELKKIHPFIGRQHLFLLRWALETAQ